MRLIRRSVIGALLALAGCGGGNSNDALERARAEAKKLAPDAVLVEVDFTGFGFATGSGGIPDMSKSGPPQSVLFNFYSPASGKGFRVVEDINRQPMPAEMQKAMEAQGYKDLRVEQGEIPYTPYTLPLPEKIGDVDRAIAAAQDSIGEECSGGDPQTSNCRLTQDAELHMFWTGDKDASGSPVWTISFGQNPKTADTVRRTVADGSYSAVSGGDQQPTQLDGSDAKPLQAVNLQAPPDFDAVWPAVIAEVGKQDPLYKPYAASIVTYLSDGRDAGGKAILSELHIEFARLTPSLLWDEVEAHVGWREGAADQAELFFSHPTRHMAPAEPKPVALKDGELPAADPTLEAMLKNFPANYSEVMTNWSQGCEDVMTFVVGLRMWRCGVYIPTETHTDLVFLWLTRAGNPYWESGRAPIRSEHDAVVDHTPKDSWAWWTRVKHPDRWEYFLTDAKTARPDPGFCTNPNDGTSPITLAACQP